MRLFNALAKSRTHAHSGSIPEALDCPVTNEMQFTFEAEPPVFSAA